METLIKIPAEEAQSIGKIDYIDPLTGCPCQIDPFTSEQKDGNYLMDETTYKQAIKIEELKPIFEKIDFDSFEKITEKEIDLKEEKQ